MTWNACRASPVANISHVWCLGNQPATLHSGWMDGLSWSGGLKPELKDWAWEMTRPSKLEDKAVARQGGWSAFTPGGQTVFPTAVHDPERAQFVSAAAPSLASCAQASAPPDAKTLSDRLDLARRENELLEAQTLRLLRSIQTGKRLMAKLRRELGALKEGALACTICCEGPRATVFQPCGHAFACRPCAHKLQTCPYCRAPPESVLDILLP